MEKITFSQFRKLLPPKMKSRLVSHEIAILDDIKTHKVQGKTYEVFLALHDGPRRYELVDG